MQVFRYRPGGPCYACLLGEGAMGSVEEISDEASARRSGQIASFVSPEDAQAMVQVGLSSDISPMCNLMVKLSLVELSRGWASGISSLEEELPYDLYIWANRRERHYCSWKGFSEAGHIPSILRWYGVRTQRVKGCPICSPSTEKMVLDTDLEGLEEEEMQKMEGER